MNKTQARLVELSNELQDIAAKYEEKVEDPIPISGLSRNELAFEEFKIWLHKEGYIYTRGLAFYKIKQAVQNCMANMSSMISELQKQNSMLMAGANIHNPPEAMMAQPQVDSSEIEDGMPIEFVTEDDLGEDVNEGH